MKSLAIDDWTQFPMPLPSPEVMGVGWDGQFQPFNHACHTPPPVQPASILKDFPEVTTLSSTQMWLKGTCEELPAGPVVRNPPISKGDVGLITGLGRSRKLRGNSAYRSQLLSLGSATREATAMWSPWPTSRESPLLAATRGKPTQQQTCAQPKIKK